MAVRSRVFSIAGFVLGAVGAVCLIVSFASPNWVEADSTVGASGFKKIGLWEVCFDNYYPHDRPAASKRYHGCWPAISTNIRDLYDSFFPSWFRGVQGMVTVSMLLAVSAVVVHIIYMIHCCPNHPQRDRLLIIITASLNFVAAMFLIISTILFGVQAKTSRYWLPYPDTIYLSWAYGFCILAGFLCLFAAMCMMTEFCKTRMEDTVYDDRRRDDRRRDSGRRDNGWRDSGRRDNGRRDSGRRDSGRRDASPSSRHSSRYAAPPPRYEMAPKHRY